MIKDYNILSYDKLRNLLLSGELEHEYMTESLYECLIDNEALINPPNITILEFCTTGLKKFDKYKEYSELSIFGGFVAKNVAIKKAKKEHKKSKASSRKSKRIAVVVVAAIIGSLLLATITAAAMRYSLIDLFRSAFNLPEKESGIVDNKNLKWSGVREYGSLNELLNAEKFTFLYPAALPDGYSFTSFEVSDYDTGLIVMLFATEPHISFEVRLGADYQIKHHEYKSNGIEYNIFELDDNLYQAHWIDGMDYYSVVVGDKATLSEIIENLNKEN